MKEVCKFKISGQKAEPWSSPKSVTATGKSEFNKKLTGWKNEVGRKTKAAMRGRWPALGAIKIRMVFYRAVTKGEVVGDYWRQGARWNAMKGEYDKVGIAADLSNLFKAAEDAIQGEAIGNDCQVVSIEAERRYGEQSGIEVEVYEV